MQTREEQVEFSPDGGCAESVFVLQQFLEPLRPSKGQRPLCSRRFPRPLMPRPDQRFTASTEVNCSRAAFLAFPKVILSYGKLDYDLFSTFAFYCVFHWIRTSLLRIPTSFQLSHKICSTEFLVRFVPTNQKSPTRFELSRVSEYS